MYFEQKLAYWTFRDLPQRTLGYRYRLDQFRRRQGVMGVEEELEEVVKY